MQPARKVRIRQGALLVPGTEQILIGSSQLVWTEYLGRLRLVSSNDTVFTRFHSIRQGRFAPRASEFLGMRVGRFVDRYSTEIYLDEVRRKAKDMVLGKMQQILLRCSMGRCNKLWK